MMIMESFDSHKLTLVESFVEITKKWNCLKSLFKTGQTAIIYNFQKNNSRTINFTVTIASLTFPILIVDFHYFTFEG